MKVSVVSPERRETIDAISSRRAVSIASSVAETVPIWLGLIRAALEYRFFAPSAIRRVSVTYRSSPTSWVRSPTASNRSFEPRGRLRRSRPRCCQRVFVEQFQVVAHDLVASEQRFAILY